jgi:hypothetical protein
VAEGKTGAASVWGAARVLILGARVRERLRLGVLGVRAGTRGGITAVRRGQPRRGGKRRAGGCAVLARSGAVRAGPASDGGGGRSAGERGKWKGARGRLGPPVAERGERRAERAEPGSQATAGGRGKLTSGPHLSAAPSGR